MSIRVPWRRLTSASVISLGATRTAFSVYPTGLPLASQRFPMGWYYLSMNAELLECLDRGGQLRRGDSSSQVRGFREAA
ncbi:MAG: hypothetical protein QW587_11785 [Candidatus Bathyarchaeia archaeon]